MIQLPLRAAIPQLLKAQNTESRSEAIISKITNMFSDIDSVTGQAPSSSTGSLLRKM